jgi:hypothetical protein
MVLIQPTSQKMFNLYIQNCHIILATPFFHCHICLIFDCNLTREKKRSNQRQEDLFPQRARTPFPPTVMPSAVTHDHVLPLIAFVIVSASLCTTPVVQPTMLRDYTGSRKQVRRKESKRAGRKGWRARSCARQIWRPRNPG